MTHELLATLGIYGANARGVLPRGPHSADQRRGVPRRNLDLGGPLALSNCLRYVILAAVGQMCAKVILYYAGMGMFEMPKGRWAREDRSRRARQAREVGEAAVLRLRRFSIDRTAARCT